MFDQLGMIGVGIVIGAFVMHEIMTWRTDRLADEQVWQANIERRREARVRMVLQLAWHARFARLPDESDDDYIKRFNATYVETSPEEETDDADHHASP